MKKNFILLCIFMALLAAACKDSNNVAPEKDSKEDLSNADIIDSIPKNLTQSERDFLNVWRELKGFTSKYYILDVPVDTAIVDTCTNNYKNHLGAISTGRPTHFVLFDKDSLEKWIAGLGKASPSGIIVEFGIYTTGAVDALDRYFPNQHITHNTHDNRLTVFLTAVDSIDEKTKKPIYTRLNGQRLMSFNLGSLYP